jgi:hypothetical protein
VAIPLVQAGTVAKLRDANLNLAETYTVTLVRGDRRTGAASNAHRGRRQHQLRQAGGQHRRQDHSRLRRPTPAKHVYTVNMPGCSQPARLFVGQRQDPFAVNLGTIFDLVNAPVSVSSPTPALINAAPNTMATRTSPRWRWNCTRAA